MVRHGRSGCCWNQWESRVHAPGTHPRRPGDLLTNLPPEDLKQLLDLYKKRAREEIAFEERPPQAASDRSGPPPRLLWLHGAGGLGRKNAASAQARRWIEASSGIRALDRFYLLAPSEYYKNFSELDDLGGVQETVLLLLDGVLREEAFLAGHSIGAKYAFKLATRFPGRFRGLLSVEGDCPAFEEAAGSFARTGLRIAFLRGDESLHPYPTMDALESLEAAGAAARVWWYKGGHSIDSRILEGTLPQVLDFLTNH